MAAPADVSAVLLALGAATLGESGGQPMDPSMRPAWPGAALAAPAFTVRCAPGDNLAVHVAVAGAPPGYALVVAATDPLDRGYWGEVLTTAAESRGIAGLVINAGVRDVAALEAHRFPVFSALVALRGASKVGPGAVGGPVRVGGVEVAPDDWVVGDIDGLTVVSGDRLQEVVAAGEARASREAELFGQLRDGRTTLDLLGLDPSTIERMD